MLGAVAAATGTAGTAVLAQPLAPSTAPQPPAQLIRIRDIRVEGTQASTPSAVLSFSGLHVGDRIASNSDAISKAIRNLMDRRLFSDVKIYAEQGTSEGVVLVIVVKEYPRIGSVVFIGNDEIDEKDLTELVTIRPGDIATPYELDRSRAKIRAKYAEEGYLFTKVAATQAPTTDSSRVQVEFNVDEGPEVKIGTITFQGNNAFSNSELKGEMEDVKEKAWWQLWRSSKFDRTKLKSDEARVVDFYRSHGFIDATITGDSIAINPGTGRTDVRIDLSEGNRVYLRSIAITGNSVYPSDVLMRRLDMELGTEYNQLRMEQNLNGNQEQTDIHSLYLDNGYLTFNSQLLENRVGDSVDVVVKMTEGGQSSIRYVSIVGNTKTKDKVIRRELYTRPGDTFSKQAVIRSLRNLANLNYFNPERLQPDVQPVDATSVDLTYQVEEKPSDTFNASVGLSSLGLSGMLGVSFNNFSAAEPLTGGAGQLMNFNWEFGTYQTTFSLGFTEPWLFDDPTSLGGSIFYQTSDLSDYKLRRYGLTANLGRRLRWPDDYFRVDVGVNVLNNKIVGDESNVVYYRNGSERSVALTLSRSSIDNPVFPTSGSRFAFSNSVAGLGDAQYTKHEVKFEFFSPVASLSETNPVVFYIGNEYGYLNDYGPIAGIPPSAFYSMGGTGLGGGFNVTPLRGYVEGSIGPVGSGGVPIGTVYTKVSSELRFGISVNPIPIYALLFAEAGNVWGRFREVDPFSLKRSAGAGLRLTIPGVGLLGFDYGFGFDRDSNGEQGGWQFHFQFGR